MRMLSRILLPLITVMIFMQSSQASVSELIREYQYSMTVEWDQKDSAFAEVQNKRLKSGIQQLLKEGTSPGEILQESAQLIQDDKAKAEVLEVIFLFEQGRMTESQMISFIDQILEKSAQRGTSWSPVLKLMAGIVGGYIIFKLVLLAIYYHDTDFNYGQPSEPPTKEP